MCHNYHHFALLHPFADESEEHYEEDYFGCTAGLETQKLSSLWQDPYY